MTIWTSCATSSSRATVAPRDLVLVVDDSPGTLGLLTDAIEEAGLTVLVAVAGTAALSLVGKIIPDVVLMDAVMPGMDGFETCRRLKETPGVAHVPVIFMTGLSETEHIVRGFEAGGVDYLTKPIDPAELVARIRVHLANARLAHSARAALDATGRFLMAVDGNGHLLWATPQAARLLAGADRLDDRVGTWLAQRRQGLGPHSMVLDGNEPRIEVTFVGHTGPSEALLQLREVDRTPPEAVLHRELGITLREAEVLLWLARGKANKDIAEILALSPRTVNKHLEQVYHKLGVENRTSAATLAIRVLEHL